MKIQLYIVILATISLSTSIYAAPHCGNLSNGYGPYDYTNSLHRRDRLQIVETHHFSKNVEQLIAGQTGHVGGDLDYTLRAFPNHQRALIAMSKLALRSKTPKPKGANYSALCYFERAIRFKPDDTMVYSIFSSHLLKIGKIDLALQQLIIANNLKPEDPTINYNLGLVYFKKKKYGEAMQYARKAYSFGFPLSGLKNQLIKVGKWEK